MTTVEYATSWGERVRLAICTDGYEQGGALALLALNVTDPGDEEEYLGLWNVLTVNLPGDPVAAAWCSEGGHVVVDANNVPAALVDALVEAGVDEGGGAEEWGSAPRGEVRGALVASASAEADALAAGGCEWAAVRVGVGGVEDVDCETGETVHVAGGR